MRAPLIRAATDFPQKVAFRWFGKGNPLKFTTNPGGWHIIIWPDIVDKGGNDVFQWNRTETKRMFFFVLKGFQIGNWNIQPKDSKTCCKYRYAKLNNADIYIFPTVFPHIFLPFPCLISRHLSPPPETSRGFELRSLVTTWLGLSMVMVGVTAVPGLLQILCIESATWRKRRQEIRWRLSLFLGGEQFLDGWMGWLFYMFFFNIWENEVGFPMAILMVCFFLLNMENVGEFLKWKVGSHKKILKDPSNWTLQHRIWTKKPQWLHRFHVEMCVAHRLLTVPPISQLIQVRNLLKSRRWKSQVNHSLYSMILYRFWGWFFGHRKLRNIQPQLHRQESEDEIFTASHKGKNIYIYT